MSGVKPARAATLTVAGGGGWLRWAVGTTLAAVVLMFCYLRIAGVTQVNSDGAGLVLQAHDMLHGNLLLHGWWATDVSFYTTELPEYLFVTAFAGVRPEVVHICSAITYTLLVLLAAFVARGRARGAEGVIRALIAAVLILAPQPTGPTLVILGNPDHIGTGVPVLVLLLVLDWAAGRPERRRWYVPVAAAVLLGWSIIGDPLIEVVGVLPLFAASVLRAGWILWSRRGTTPEAGQAGPAATGAAAPGLAASGLAGTVRRGWSAAWYEWSLALAAVAAYALAAAGNQIIKSLGGFAVAKPFYHLQHLHEIVHGLRIAAESVFVLFGADFTMAHGAGDVAFAFLHLIGVAIALGGFCFGVWCLLRPFVGLARLARGSGVAVAPGDLVTDILVLAIAANCLAFILEVPMENIYSSHEIAPVLSLGAALAGRTLGPLIYRGRAAAEPAAASVSAPPAPGSSPARPGARRVLLPALAAVLVVYTVMLGIGAAHRQSPPRNVSLAAWLVKHHLTSGFAPYWEASSIIVDTGRAVTLLAVTDSGWHGHVAPQKWETDTLLPDKMPPARFVILSPAEKVRKSAVIATFGKPAKSYRYGPFTILVWRQDLVPLMKRADKKPATRTVAVSRPDSGAGQA